MTKGGGKGRISNTLVAASCAAVLTVYAAGYWRTRDEARRMDARAQERRPVRNVPALAPATNSASVPEPPAAPPAPPEPSPPSASRSTASQPSAAPTSVTPPPATSPSAEKPSAAQNMPAQAQVAAKPATSQPAPQPSPESSAPAPSLADAGDPPPSPPPDSPPAHGSPWRDGTYTGWGTSRHGDIKAQVVIRNGRIMEASIASCETRYPCDVIGDIIAQPVARQSPDVDRVSRATESADAYYYGLVEALKEAQMPPDGEITAAP